MKYTITLIAALLLSNFCNAQRLVSTYYDWNKIHPHEQYYVNGAGQKNGTFKEYNENGVVIREYNYVNGLENGVCVDYAASTNNQRVIASKGTFKNGELDGSYVQYCKYDDYKSKVQEGQYKIGKKFGLHKEWWCTEIYDNVYKGVLKSVGSYSDDNQIGEWKFYFTNGAISSKGSYVNGRENGYWVYYSKRDSTKPFSYGNYINGTKVGKWTLPINEKGLVCDINDASSYSIQSFDSAGKFTRDVISVFRITGEKFRDYYLTAENTKTGTETLYFPNGKVQSQRNYETGVYKEFYQGGALKWEGQYNGQNITGQWKSYYESGKLKSDENYLTNAGKVYFETGKLHRDEKYRNGVVSSYVEYDENGEMVSAQCNDAVEYNRRLKKDKAQLLKAKINQMASFINNFKDDNSKFSFDVCESSEGFSALIGTLALSENENRPYNSVFVTKHIDSIKAAITLYYQSDELKNLEVANQIRILLEKIIP